MNCSPINFAPPKSTKPSSTTGVRQRIKGVERHVIASDSKAIQTKPQVGTPGLLRSARNDG